MGLLSIHKVGPCIRKKITRFCYLHFTRLLLLNWFSVSFWSSICFTIVEFQVNLYSQLYNRKSHKEALAWMTSYKIGQASPPVDLYLSFEIPSLKNQVQWIWYLSSLNLIFAGYTGSKNQVRTRLKIKFVKLDFSNGEYPNSSTD